MILHPMRDMLASAQGRARFHMPGHKGLLDLNDMTELASTDDLHSPSSGIREAELLIARSAGAGDAIMLTGGATAGNIAMLMFAASRYKRVRLERSAHLSAVSGLILGGLEIGESGAAFATRPDYYGLAGELPQAELLMVDEAHGAHFNWWDKPQSAGRLGADLWVQSAHKTLPALTGGAWLFMKDPANYMELKSILRLVTTSSPPFPILLSLDEARAFMDERGACGLSRVSALADGIRREVSEIEGLESVHADDPTRLVIDVSGRGITGYRALGALHDLGVDAELADERRVVFICTVCDSEESFARLSRALRELPRGTDEIKSVVPAFGIPRVPPREAALAPMETVAIERAQGRIASRAVGAYPPGAPWIMPGDEITPESIESLVQASASGAELFGAYDGRVFVMREQ